MKRSHHKKKLNLISFKGGSCGDLPDVSQYSNPNGMIQAQDGYQNIFERVFLGPGATETNLKVPNCHAKQAGGGFVPDFSDPIAGQPAIKSYSDCCPPVYHNGQMFLTKGTEPQCGSGRSSPKRKMSQRKVKDKKMKPSLKKSKSKSHAKSRHGSRKACQCTCRPCKCPRDSKGQCPCLPGYKTPKKTQRKSKVGGGKKKSQKQRKGKRQQKSKRRQKGGQGGVASVFTGDMKQRTFGARQPDWDPKDT